jgi:hypothetical protein
MQKQYRYPALILGIFLIALCYSDLSAQKSTVYTNPYTSYLEGLELFNKEKYGSAQIKFQDAIRDLNDKK